MPTPRGAIWALIFKPSSTACFVSSSTRFQPLRFLCFCTSEKVSGRPEASISLRISANSPSTSSASKSVIICRMPRPASFTPIAMAVSSSSDARSVGVGVPLTLLWLIEREVENPIAPARMASDVRARICAASSAFAISSREARSPIT